MVQRLLQLIHLLWCPTPCPALSSAVPLFGLILPALWTGKLATLKGTVTRMSHVRPLMADMTFTCNKCGSTMKVDLPDGRFTPPTRCGGQWAACDAQAAKRQAAMAAIGRQLYSDARKTAGHSGCVVAWDTARASSADGVALLCGVMCGRHKPCCAVACAVLCFAIVDEGCKGRSFLPDPSSARCIDWQKLRLQELLGVDQQQQGKVPRTVEVRPPSGSCLVLRHAALCACCHAQLWVRISLLFAQPVRSHKAPVTTCLLHARQQPPCVQAVCCRAQLPQ